MNIRQPSDYWGMTKKQRSELTEEQLQRIAKLILMEEGCADPVHPNLAAEEPVVLQRRLVWVLVRRTDRWNDSELDLAFPDAAAAQAFLGLGVMKLEGWGEERHTVQLGGYRIEQREIALEQSVVEKRDAMQRLAAARESNRKVLAEYEKAKKAAEQTLEAFWRSVEETRVWKAACEMIAHTMIEYVNLSGDDVVARRFLRKRFDDELITEAIGDRGVPLLAPVHPPDDDDEQHMALQRRLIPQPLPKDEEPF